jgi:two-component system sensor histidine kinase KdpD
LGIGATTAVLKLFGGHVNPTTVALALLMVVLFVATKWSARPAVVAALLGMLCYNFFFLPPIGTLTITDSDNWVGLVAFLVTAVTAGQLSARAKRRAEEAEAGRRDIFSQSPGSVIASTRERKTSLLYRFNLYELFINLLCLPYARDLNIFI